MKTSFLLVVTTITALTMASWTYWLAIHKSDELSFLASVRQIERQETERTIAQLKSELADMRKQLILNYNPVQTRKTVTWKPHKSKAYRPLPGNTDYPGSELTQDKRFAVLQDAYMSENHDPDWASRRENELINQFKQLNLSGSHLLDAGCRSSMCRIEVYHEDSYAEAEFVAQYAQMDRFIANGDQSFHRAFIDGNGDRRSLLFSARLGHTLPTGPQAD